MMVAATVGGYQARSSYGVPEYVFRYGIVAVGAVTTVRLFLVSLNKEQAVRRMQSRATPSSLPRSPSAPGDTTVSLQPFRQRCAHCKRWL